MKKITLLLMLMVASVSFGQLKTSKVEEGVEIGKIAPMGQLHISLTKYDQYHILAYRDMTYTQITEAKSFTIMNNEVEDLYNFIIKGFEEKEAGETKVELADATITVKFAKALGAVNVQLVHWVTKDGSVQGITQYLTKKQVDKLFGKSKK